MSEQKDENQHKTPKQKQKEKFARRMAFSRLVDSKKSGDTHWVCCNTEFSSAKFIHLHISQEHAAEVEKERQQLLTNGDPDAKWKLLRPPHSEEKAPQNNEAEKWPSTFTESDQYPWLPVVTKETDDESQEGQVLLFYKYKQIPCPQHLCEWQKELCRRLNLTGKIRVASEGINATVAGRKKDTQAYIEAFMKHPFFRDMTLQDFKTSPGGTDVFPEGLKVGIFQEIVPMGIPPSKLSHENTAQHLTPAEFHEAAQRALQDTMYKDSCLFVDCRNFYESKIGHFKGALAPDIRKFSYWPEYVDKNEELFKDKDVYMYCTGGIRCERGAAYLKQKGVCRSLYQLEGGIHRYIEQFPDGYFRGKLFVFDDRYTIKANEDVLSQCVYCKTSWDRYEPCTTEGCFQLVLSCDGCRGNGLTTCCRSCAERNPGSNEEHREQCECTKARERIPCDVK